MMFDPHFHTSRFILEKLLKDNFHTRKKRTVNIPDDRVLQLTQQILEMLKSMVLIFHQASFQYCRLSMDHGTSCSEHGWMYGRSGRTEKGTDLVVVLSCSSNLFLLIQLKWGMGVGGGVWLSRVCIELEYV